MTLAQVRRKDSEATTPLLHTLKEPAALLQESKSNPGVAEMPEEMVGLEGELTLPEQDSGDKVQDTRADQGVAMLQHADQIYQTGELFEEDAPLSEFKESRGCSEESCRPEARQWWELLGNF